VRRLFGYGPAIITVIAEKILEKIVGRKVEPIDGFRLNYTLANKSTSSLAIHLHIHFSEFVSKAWPILESAPYNAHLYITTTNRDLERLLIESTPKERSDKVTILLVENRGRNFKPLFVDLAKQVLSHEYLLHLHSKKTLHGKRNLGDEWADRLWSNLVPSSQIFKEAFSMMQDNPKIGIFYPSTFDLLPSSNFRFGPNIKIANKYSRILGVETIRFDQRRFQFPAGGMFLVRTSAISNLLEARLTGKDFPNERRQKDATTQHMLERIISLNVLERGFKQLVFYQGTKKFSFDVSFIRHGEVRWWNAK
jgi:lipopolysaccharide biosynthesis protein